MVRYLLGTHEATIVQRFVEGVEFGIFYRRMPGEPRGHIVSIAETRHPMVVGDGRATLGALLREGPWVAARAASRGMFNAGRLCAVPFEGERVHLFEIGFCSHNATFIDRRDLCTPMLEETVSRAHPVLLRPLRRLRSFPRRSRRGGSGNRAERCLAEPTHLHPATSIARLPCRRNGATPKIGAAIARRASADTIDGPPAAFTGEVLDISRPGWIAFRSLTM
jgi:hypothetical protein